MPASQIHLHVDHLGVSEDHRCSGPSPQVPLAWLGAAWPRGSASSPGDSSSWPCGQWVTWCDPCGERCKCLAEGRGLCGTSSSTASQMRAGTVLT